MNWFSRALHRAVSNLWRSASLVGLVCLASAHSSQLHAQTLPPACGTLYSEGRFGPFDYRPEGYVPETTFGSHKALLHIVEPTHFPPEVEAGIRGHSTSYAAGDISYTLHAFPNHHRALIAISNIGIREKTDTPLGSKYSIECWFLRAMSWRPDDLIVRLIFASHLTQTKRIPEATAQADFVAAKAGENAFTHLNVGLVYFDMGKFDLALKQAHMALALGLKSPVLKDRLVQAGKWLDDKSPVETIEGKASDLPPEKRTP